MPSSSSEATAAEKSAFVLALGGVQVHLPLSLFVHAIPSVAQA